MIESFGAAVGADRVLLLFALGTGLLFLVAVGFALLTLGLRLRNVRRQTSRRRLETLWEPLLLDYLGGDRSAEDVRARVPDRSSAFFLEYLLRFFSRFTGDERRMIRDLARPYLPIMVERLQSRRPEIRARAVQTLIRLGLDRHDRAVIAALDDPAATVAMVAARTLASREHTRFAPEILRRLHRFRSWHSGYLASMFAEMGSDVVPALREIYRDPDADVVSRRIAADALYHLDDIASADDAYRVAWAEEDLELVASSMRLLARVGRAEHAPLARQALNSSHPLLRLRAAEALSAVGGEQDLLRLRAALDDPSPWVQLAAAYALAASGGASLLEALLDRGDTSALLAREALTHARPRS